MNEKKAPLKHERLRALPDAEEHASGNFQVESHSPVVTTSVMQSYLPLLLVFLSGIGFSIQSLFIKILTDQYSYSASFQIIFFRGLTQGVLSTIFIYTDPSRQDIKLFGNTNSVRGLMLMRSLFGYGGIAFAFLAVERLPMGDATTLTMLSPMFATLFSWYVLREQWRLGEMISSLVAVVGVCLVGRPAFIFGQNEAADSTGVVYALLAAVFAGLAYTCVRMLGTTSKMPWANVCFAQAIGQAVLSPPSLTLSGQTFRFDMGLTVFGLIFTAGFIGAWSQISMTIGMQREKSALATGMRMSDVLFGFIWQALFTHEPVSSLSIVGAMLVTLSVVGLVLSKAYYPQNMKNGSNITSDINPTRDGEVYSVVHMDSTHEWAGNKSDLIANEEQSSTHTDKDVECTVHEVELRS
jgi:drug/metabolite transporter (DMT)-like permease